MINCRLHIDGCRLFWKLHTEYIKRNLSKAFTILCKTKDLLNKKVITLYCLITMPYMTYCVEVWGNVYKTKLDPIIKLQKRAMKIINMYI